ncbi:MAG TPA: hypothetical protein PKC72_06100 [Chitinophagaceae bacterium]|nr:hypothetical protein [Chitinophagaceae bacterium]
MDLSGQWIKAISDLRKAKNSKDQLEFLWVCHQLPVNSPGILRLYHDALLFVCAYPFSTAASKTAMAELRKLAETCHKHQNKRKWQLSLSGTGIPFSEIYCQFSLHMVNWMFEKFPGKVKPAEIEENEKVSQAICRTVLPGIEFYLINEGAKSTRRRIKLLSGHNLNTEAVKWLVQLICHQSFKPVLQDYLYDLLKIYVSWPLTDDVWNRSFLRWPCSDLFIHKQLVQKINVTQLVQRPVQEPGFLSKKDKDHLISVMKASLAFYMRETDPVTYADTHETCLFDMGEGLKIALTGMKKEHRLSVESYVGFMAFKNGVPVAYGGGWIFGFRCKIGVNVYHPFRGGESEKLFCQVMRLYFQRFGVRKFVVKPYQFGKGNIDGLKSGAFWFYYKLGFRSVNNNIRFMASEEWKKISADKGYRTSLSRLKKFSESNISWQPVKKKIVDVEAELISIKVTQMIIQKFHGDRQKAISSCMRFMRSKMGLSLSGISKTEKQVWQNWSLIFYLLPDVEYWTHTQLIAFSRIVRLKANGKEKDSNVALQKHSAFWSSAEKLSVLF